MDWGPKLCSKFKILFDKVSLLSNIDQTRFERNRPARLLLLLLFYLFLSSFWCLLCVKEAVEQLPKYVINCNEIWHGYSKSMVDVADVFCLRLELRSLPLGLHLCWVSIPSSFSDSGDSASFCCCCTMPHQPRAVGPR